MQTWILSSCHICEPGHIGRKKRPCASRVMLRFLAPMTGLIPSLSSFCRSDPSVRFVSFVSFVSLTILATGSLPQECARSSLTFALALARRTTTIRILSLSEQRRKKRIHCCDRAPGYRGPQRFDHFPATHGICLTVKTSAHLACSFTSRLLCIRSLQTTMQANRARPTTVLIKRNDKSISNPTLGNCPAS